MSLVQETKKLCAQYNIQADKRFGQNFLIEEKVLEDIIRFGKVETEDNVLEIGPGLGLLTRRLLQHAKKVLSVELDKRMTEVLQDLAKEFLHFQYIQADILSVSNTELKKNFSKSSSYKVIANIPYNISSLIMKKFLSEADKPSMMLLMVQKEIAERIVLRDGKMSLLALQAHLYAKPKMLRVVKKSCFYPAPQVDSALLLFEDIQEDVFVGPQEEKQFWALAKAGFAHKRKKLSSNLAEISQKSKEFLEGIFQEMGYTQDLRAEELSVEEWKVLYSKIYL